MAQDPSPDLVLTPLEGKPITVRQALTTFHLLLIAIDPFTNESSWILPTARRTLANFAQADCRVAFLVTGDADQSRQFLGSLVDEFRVFIDPSYETAKGFGLQSLPAIVMVGQDGTVRMAAEGWAATQWQAVTDAMAQLTSWRGPQFPDSNDPGAFEGTPLPVA